MGDTTISPQEGPQTMAFASPAGIVVYGGAAGGGKSWWLLTEPLRHIHEPRFRAALYRRQHKDMFGPGGLWDEARVMYEPHGGIGVQSASSPHFKFPSGAEIHFRNVQYDKDMYNEKGMQCSYIGVDEADQFSEKVVFYLKSRNRDQSPVKPRFMMTCNPNGESWLAKFIQWWWDQETGFAIPERAGKMRYVDREGEGNFLYYDKIEDVPNYDPEIERVRDPDDPKLTYPPMRMTFIPAKITDNPAMLRDNPDYAQSLRMQDPVERQRLLEGNWLAIDDKGSDWKAHIFEGIWVAEEDVPWDQIRFSTIAVDPALGKKNKPGDDSSICWCGATRELIYVIIDSERRNPSELIEDFFDFTETLDSKMRSVGNNLFNPIIGMESVGFQDVLIGQLTQAMKKKKGSYLRKWVQAGGNIVPVPADGSKTFRIRRLSDKFTEHAFRFVEGYMGNTKCVKQARMFPNNTKSPDALDSLEMANRVHLISGY